MADKLKIGFIVNPIAGMGGKTALKGTDGAEALQKALSKGAVPEAGEKAKKALMMLEDTFDQIVFLTCPGDMGESALVSLGADYETVIGRADTTTAADTRRAAQVMVRRGACLLLFAGGDGTARDICGAVGDAVPVVGIPAGVKIQSAVFALSPRDGGALARLFIRGGAKETELREVVDLDEDEYRCHRLSAKLYGYMAVPKASGLVQDMKVGKISSDKGALAGAARCVIEDMQPGRFYAIGSGSSAKVVMEQLGLDYELLGIDVIKDGKIVVSDADERALLDILSAGAMGVVVSPIGGQGFLFGRGNRQFSSRILDRVGKENVTVLSTLQKLLTVSSGRLRVDTGDEDVDTKLKGFYNVVCGYRYFVTMPCE